MIEQDIVFSHRRAANLVVRKHQECFEKHHHMIMGYMGLLAKEVEFAAAAGSTVTQSHLGLEEFADVSAEEFVMGVEFYFRFFTDLEDGQYVLDLQSDRFRRLVTTITLQPYRKVHVADGNGIGDAMKAAALQATE